jgi:sulfhydrogenase subunit beta (sulfur reductase)
MKAKILQKSRLLEFVAELTRDHEVIAPIDERSFARISSASEVHLGSDKPAMSLKEFVFPQREVLLQYLSGTAGTELAVPAPETDKNQVILGARPCDAAALPIVDKVFLWDYIDSAYVQRRQNTVVVSMACEQPCKTCFCVSLGGSPAGIDGSDVLLTPLNDIYHVQIITDRGSALIADYEDLFQDSDQRRDRQRAQFEEDAQARMTKAVDIGGLDKTLDFHNPIWETIAQQCIDCGICTFLCPTCHCFDIQDEGNRTEGERVRLWDACTFYNYTKAHAGQPRPTHYRRYRQRIMHKFRYYPENFGRTLCVGCGRCIQYCPVSIDLTQVLKAVKE